MHLNENARFMFLTMGIFCVTLGIAILVFSLIERILFRISFVGIFLDLSSVALAIGTLILVFVRRMG